MSHQAVIGLEASASASASSESSVASEVEGSDIDWEAMLQNADFEDVWDTFEGGVSEDQAEDMGEGLFVEGGAAVAKAFGIPPAASKKILGPLGDKIGRPIGRGVKKAVDWVGGLFKKDRDKPTPVAGSEGTWIGVLPLQKKYVDEEVILPLLAALQLQHKSLGLTGRYLPSDIMQSLSQNFGLETESSDYVPRRMPGNTVSPFSPAVEEIQQEWTTELWNPGLARYIPANWGKQKYWAPNFYQDFSHVDSGEEWRDGNSQRFHDMVAEWEESFRKAVGKEMARLGILAGTIDVERQKRVEYAPSEEQQRALADKKNLEKKLIDFMPGSFRSFYKSSAPEAKELRQMAQRYSEYGLPGIAAWYVFRDVSGPNSDRPAWWTAYWQPRLDQDRWQVVKDTKAWLSKHGSSESNQFVALAKALDYAYNNWLGRVWDIEKRIQESDKIPGSFKRFALQAGDKTAADPQTQGEQEVNWVLQAKRNAKPGEVLLILAGPQTTRTNWWTEAFQPMVEAGKGNVYKDVKAWADRHPDIVEDSPFEALGLGLDYAYTKWLERVWGKEAVRKHAPNEPRVAASGKSIRGIWLDPKTGELKGGDFQTGQKKGLLVDLSTGRVVDGSFKLL